MRCRLLRANPAVACDDDAWHGLAALGGIGTVLYSLGFPLLCWCMTRAARRKQTSSATKGTLLRANARAKLLLSSYRPGASWLGALARAGSPAC